MVRTCGASAKCEVFELACFLGLLLGGSVSRWIVSFFFGVTLAGSKDCI